MSEVKQRLVEEQKELCEKLNKLNNFIETNNKFPTLSQAQQFLLWEQLEVMGRYNQILLARLSIME